MQPPKEPILRENTYFEPLMTFLWHTVRPVQVSKNIKHIDRKNRHGVTTSPPWGHAPI